VNYVNRFQNCVKHKTIIKNNFVNYQITKCTLKLINMTAIEFQHKLISLQDNLMRFAYSLTADKDDAKDLVQDTFFKALKYCDKFVHGTNFKGWIFSIMKNTFINNYNRSTYHKVYCDQTEKGFWMNYSQGSNNNSPDSIYASKELENIINSLDSSFKIPFKMHHEGFKYKEIAETLDINIGTVKSRIFFTRKKLIKQLKG
jgi:RNA polymerase sigma factor (sigma-70 family)